MSKRKPAHRQVNIQQVRQSGYQIYRAEYPGATYSDYMNDPNGFTEILDRYAPEPDEHGHIKICLGCIRTLVEDAHTPDHLEDSFKRSDET